MYRIDEIYKARKINLKMKIRVHAQETHTVCNGTATMCHPDIADDMIMVIREASDKAIQHLELLKANYNDKQ
jgi:hypothetical protein